MNGVLPSAIVLTGGESQRLGRPKALVEFSGKTLIAWAVDHLRAAGCNPVVVVAHPHLVTSLETILEGVVVVENPHPERGRTGSLQIGFQTLMSLQKTLSSVVMAPIDRPGWNIPLVHRLLEHGGSACPRSNGIRGHPVVFDSESIAQVMQADTSAPLRNVVSFQSVELDAPWLHLNIDTSEDVESLQSHQSELLAYFLEGEGI